MNASITVRHGRSSRILRSHRVESWNKYRYPLWLTNELNWLPCLPRNEPVDHVPTNEFVTGCRNYHSEPIIHTRPFKKIEGQNQPTHVADRIDLDALRRETDRILQFLQSKNSSSYRDTTLVTRNNQPQQRHTSKTDIVTSQECYALLESWMKVARQSLQIEAAQQAEAILVQLEQFSSSDEHNKRTALTPTTFFYDLVLQAYAVCRGGRSAAEAAQSLLRRMMKADKATTKSCNIVIHCWAKSGVADAGEKAEQIWTEMEQREKQKNHGETLNRINIGISPNARTLTSVIEAWANSGKSSQTSDRIYRLLEIALNKERAMPLDVVVFNTIIRALTRTEPNRRQGAEKAERVLQLLEETQLSLTPNTQKI